MPAAISVQTFMLLRAPRFAEARADLKSVARPFIGRMLLSLVYFGR
jgi:hypothetical protein